MQISFLALIVFSLSACTAVKYNAHVGADGSGGYLRTYYSSEKNKVNPSSEGTGIEQCKTQGSDVLCRDLNIVIALDKKPATSPQSPTPPTPAKAVVAPVKQPAAKK